MPLNFTNKYDNPNSFIDGFKDISDIVPKKMVRKKIKFIEKNRS